MKIAILTKRFPPERCGVGDFAFRLAQELAARGEDVVVFTSPHSQPAILATCAEARPRDVRVVEIPLRGWRDISEIIRAFRREHIERVQIEYSGYAWSRLGCAFWVNALAAALRLNGIPVTLGLHELYVRFTAAPRSWIPALLQRLHIALLAPTASEIVTNMPERVRVLRRWMPWRPERIRYRPNASNIGVAPFDACARAALRARLGAGPETLVVACFGTFAAAKYVEAVIRGMALLRELADARLWLIGDCTAADPRYIAKLREEIAALGLTEKTYWSGPLVASEVSQRLQAADIFVLTQPDGHLTRSGAFMAAAAHGLPVIAVRNAANQEEFAHGENAWLVESSRAELFTKAIAELAADRELRERLGHNLRALYERTFDWPVIAAAPADERVAPVMAKPAGRRI